MKKSIKTKVLSGAVAVGLLSSVGVAFASTDAGTNLQNWYNSQFGKSAASIQTQTTNYAVGKAPGLVNEYNGLRTNAVTSINGTKTAETAAANTAINNAKKEHLDALAAQKLAIQNHLQSQFDGIQQAADTIIGQVGLLAIDYANKDLTKLTGDKGSAALTSLTTDLNKSSDDAVKELQDAIDAAKADLQSQLDSATASRVDNIKHIIDKKIDELRGTITTKKNELVAAQQKLITEKAQKLQAQAEADLAAAVAGI
ncbi:hypothetical protein J1P26_09055 [Neobacillus sp. MM2021_6]|uniref:hypothetical protein n=1 Tax=Bacillaceae TaxID=186817 RepID=UPI00140B413D|nr:MULTISPECIES: hypothetical protein [Bacillaceae]MBO0959872.1 hypothetical protein [Neobacillus sp. MM2021_6]NHC20480.1 hypothetical protein [Bacillus sp. MM2020_4]